MGRTQAGILGIVALCIFEGLLIVGLLITHLRHRKANRDRERLASLDAGERRRLEEVISNMPSVVWESRIEPGGATLKTEFVSHYVETMLGYSEQQCLSTPDFWLSIIPDEDREDAERARAAIIKDGKEGSLQFRCVAKDGQMRWVEAHMAVIRDEKGEAIGVRSIAIDITSRKLAEESLRESEEKTRAIMHAIPDLMFLLTDDGTYLDYRAKDARDLFVPPSVFLGQNMKDFLPPELAERFFASFRSAEETDEPQVVEYSLQIQDVERWFEARVVRTEGRKILCMVRDVTARREAEAALQLALEEVNRLKNQLSEENTYLREEIKLQHDFDEIVGRSDAIKYVLFKIEQVAPTDTTVLILGETGTGKELIARAIHNASRRKDRPLVRVNCAALPSGLIESELFGHEKGAFTGAVARQLGRFELANDATVFLDEIGELPLELQVKLLRVLQEGEIERLGGAKTIKVDIRIIAATNRNLKEEVEKGLFREDLWYRLNVFPITAPPLRQRKEDIPMLVDHFVAKFSEKMNKKITSIPPSAMRALQEYSWAGNIRELANVIERAVINSGGSNLRLADPLEAHQPAESPPASRILEDVEREYIIRILNETGWRIEGPTGAAKILGLNPSTLRTRMAKLGIQKPKNIAM